MNAITPICPVGIKYPSGSSSTTPQIKEHHKIASPTKEASSGTEGKDFTDVVRQGGNLLSKLVRVIADAIEVQPESGIATESHFERHSASGPSGTKTTHSTSFTTTTDPVKQAAFLRGTVAPAVTKFADGLVNGNIHLGGETVTLRELGAFVTGAEPAISPLFDLIARKFSGKSQHTETKCVSAEPGKKETTEVTSQEQQPTSTQQSTSSESVVSIPLSDKGTLKTLLETASDEQLGAFVRELLENNIGGDQTPPDDGPKPVA